MNTQALRWAAGSILTSYAIQRFFNLAPTKTHMLGLLGSSVFNSTVQLISVFAVTEFTVTYSDYFYLELGVIQTAFIAATFFANFGFQIISGNVSSSAGELSLALANASKATAIYVFDCVIKLTALVPLILFEDVLRRSWSMVSWRWEQLKENITLCYHHLARRYEYYSFPVYQTKEDFAALSKEKLEATRVHYIAYPQKWKQFSISMQVAFNLFLKAQELPLLSITASLEKDGVYSKEELQLLAKERYRYYQISPDEALVFFHHHVKPPKYFLEAGVLPQLPIPEASQISLLSKPQVKWFHQIIVAGHFDLTTEQYSAFAAQFYKYGLLAPNERFVFDVELSSPSDRYIPMEKVYYYYLYVLAGKDLGKSNMDRMYLYKFLMEKGFACALPKISEKDLLFLSKEVLSIYAEQFTKHLFLWEQQPALFKSEFNRVLRQHQLEPVQGQRFAFFKNVFSQLIGAMCGLGYYSDVTLMHVTNTGQNPTYLQTIPNERVDYLHPTMVRDLPDNKIRHVTRPDLIREIPKNKLFFIHPKVFPILTDQQKGWMNECVEQVDSLSLEQTRLLLCPWLVRKVSEIKRFEVSQEGRKLVISPTQISQFHQAFFSLIRTPQEVWEEMTLVEQIFFDLKPFGDNRYSEIDGISSNLAREFHDIAHFFRVGQMPNAWRMLLDVGSTFFSDDYITAEQDREKMLYDFKHLIYALKKMKELDPPLDNETKATVGTLINQLYQAMGECKTAWISALMNFEGKRNEFCDCADCKEIRSNSKEVFLKSKLGAKLALYKRDCFRKVILKAYNLDGAHDGQQVHTEEWYARALPHLNLYSGYSDQYSDISRQTVSPLEIQRRLMIEYMGTVKSFVKDLLSYGKDGDIEFREAALDFISGMILREAQKRDVYINKAWAKDVATEWIWDKENAFAVREAFVGILLYSFDYYQFDPMSEVFSRAQSNQRLLSGNLDLVSVKLNQLDQ